MLYPLSSQGSGVTGRYGGNTIPEGSDVGKSPSFVPPVRVNPRYKSSHIRLVCIDTGYNCT